MAKSTIHLSVLLALPLPHIDEETGDFEIVEPGRQI
ncbi:hypothetical protein BFJ66_g16997 [Fusarium oxysporum f. sp. cepae]|nr:hypothetical protein BFJ67_g17374 [Fusarium oxysporum f. sp. cepae]RKK26707.1 hypothetical protein BFJ66_g16997 [Fusarium oxysporum f. sp. cepae]